jgi:cysteine desulfurase/selenocysteine lyase
LGTVVPVEKFIAVAKRHGVPVLLDGAQAVPHSLVDVRKLDCDFYCFSAHKLCGPTGMGVLYGREALLQAMPPWQGGGDMILTVSFEKTTYNQLPWKFEAGTPHIAARLAWPPHCAISRNWAWTISLHTNSNSWIMPLGN